MGWNPACHSNGIIKSLFKSILERNAKSVIVVEVFGMIGLPKTEKLNAVVGKDVVVTETFGGTILVKFSKLDKRFGDGFIMDG